MKILHTADIHLGTNTFGRIDPTTGLNTRLQDFRRSFEYMVQRGLAEHIDLFLFCGDAYRTADPTPTQQKVFAECLKPLADHGVPMVMVTGNHDHPVSFGKATSIDIFSHLSGEVHVYRRPTLEIIETRAGPLQLLAMPWPVRNMLLFGKEWHKKSAADLCTVIEEKYLTLITAKVEQLKPSIPTVLAGHFSVQGSLLSGSERTSVIAKEPQFTPAQLSPPPIDYVALGHIHQHQNCALDEAATPVVYSGSIERVTFREQYDPKGFVLVNIEGQPRRTTYEFVETPARRFVSLHVDARKSTNPTQTILDHIAQTRIEEAIVRLRFQITEPQRSLLDIQAVRQALNKAFAIASIEREMDTMEREQRTDVTRESSLEDALRGYISQHPNLEPLTAELVQKALELEELAELSKRADN